MSSSINEYNEQYNATAAHYTILQSLIIQPLYCSSLYWTAYTAIILLIILLLIILDCLYSHYTTHYTAQLYSRGPEVCLKETSGPRD